MNELVVLDDNGDPIPCVFPPWLRQIASQRPVAVRWYALAFAYDGHKVYLRLIGLAKPTDQLALTSAPAVEPPRRAKPSYMVVKVNEKWHVLDMRARKRRRKRKTVIAVAGSRAEAHAIAGKLRGEARAA